MPQMMDALKSSEQGYREYSMSAFNSSSSYVAEDERRFRWYHAALLILPGAATAAVLGYQGVLKQQMKISEVVNQPTSVEQVSAPFERLNYPDFGKLKTTYIDENESSSVLSDQLISKATAKSSGTDKQQKVVSVPDEVVIKPEKQGEAINLDGLDLSALSPSLAMRVQSALKSNTGSSGSDSSASDSSAIPLVEYANQFIGKLPKMNFQTHVYASEANKRWVKVNGIEYQEGSALNDKVVLVAIKPRATLIRYNKQLIEVPALYDWKG